MKSTHTSQLDTKSAVTNRLNPERSLGGTSGLTPPNSTPPASPNGGGHQLYGSSPDFEGSETSSSPESKPSNRRWIFLAGGLAALLLGTGLGWRWWSFQQHYVTTDNATLKGHLSPIAARIPATVQKVFVSEGDQVSPGQTLLILEDEDLKLKAQEAQANLAAAQAALNQAQHTVTVSDQTNPAQVQQAQANLAAQQSAIEAAQAQVKQAQADVISKQASTEEAQTEVTKTRADFYRYQTLYQAGAIAAQQFDTAKAAYETAQSKLKAANQAVDQAQASVKTAQAQLQSAQANAVGAKGKISETKASGKVVTVQQDQVQQAQAKVKQAQATLDLAQQQMQYTVIKAPVGGVVGPLTAQIGQKVQSGQPLLTVVPLKAEDVYIEANFKETALNRLKIGESADIKLDAYPDKTFQAKVAGISPATGSSYALIPPDNATGNFNKVVRWIPVRLEFAAGTEANGLLRPGLSAEVTVDTTISSPAT